MPIRSLPELCWLLSVDHGCGPADGDEWHSLGGDGSVFFSAVAAVWANAPDVGTPVPVPWQDDSPCLVISCAGCGLVFGPRGGGHFASEVDALDEVAEAGWLGEWCPACRGGVWDRFWGSDVR